MGVLGERISGRDVAIGVVLSLSIGLGVLFLHFYTAYATQVTALLFGNVLGVNRQTLWTLLGLAIVSLAGLALIARPLLFASLQPELAEAKGVSLQLVSLLFLAIVALTVAECAQIVGVLLVFTLMVGPAAAAGRWTTRLGRGVALAAALALAEAWAGIALAYYTDWPTSFWITALSAAVYFASLLPLNKIASGMIIRLLCDRLALCPPVDRGRGDPEHAAGIQRLRPMPGDGADPGGEIRHGQPADGSAGASIPRGRSMRSGSAPSPSANMRSPTRSS